MHDLSMAKPPALLLCRVCGGTVFILETQVLNRELRDRLICEDCTEQIERDCAVQEKAQTNPVMH